MNIKVLGTSFTLTSSLKKDDIEKLQKYQPAGLKMVDAETKDVVFAIASSSKASINNVGVSFNAKNEDGFAQASFDIPADVTDKEKYIVDNFGLAMLKLGEIEEFAAAQLTDLNNKFERVGGNIEIVG